MRSEVANNRPRPPLWSWLWPVPVGLAFGAVALAPFVRGPGDPTGYVIGAGLGGTLGLVTAAILRGTKHV